MYTGHRGRGREVISPRWREYQSGSLDHVTYCYLAIILSLFVHVVYGTVYELLCMCVNVYELIVYMSCLYLCYCACVFVCRLQWRRKIS